MAKEIIRKPICTVNGVDLTNRFSSVEINSEKDLVDVTAFGANSKQNMLGLGDGTMSFDAFQDFAVASVDATLYPIHANNSEVVITVKPRDEVVSATNPLYTMTGVLPNYTPLAGSVGEASTISVEFSNSGDAGIVRSTS
jgi:hypothetical protein